MIQEDVEHKSAVLIIKAGKITGKLLAKAVLAALHQMRKERKSPGKMRYKQLSKGGPLQNIEIMDDNIKAFDPIAREFDVKYALKKDVSTDPPRWLVFFRAKDTDALTAAFRKFTAITLEQKAEKPSVRETMAKFREFIKNAVIDRTKHKHREGPER
ncbi:MAG: PcfB family protein [Christensenellaceae bacterium]|jgi:hypothetical protein|nr:PcfB family protein [Christensenellaceae bacterium]